MAVADITEATGYHYRFMVAAYFSLAGVIYPFFFKTAEIPTQVWPTKFVVERGSTYWAFKHNIQRRSDVGGLAKVNFPRLRERRNF